MSITARIVNGDDDTVYLFLFGEETMPGGSHVLHAWLCIEGESACVTLADRRNDDNTGYLTREVPLSGDGLRAALEAMRNHVDPVVERP
jgi:hypothetical protein